VLGPSYNLMSGDLFEDFLGVSSHELFHSWNIKTIRPIEMQPYDYTKENYSRSGYVYEGATSYYGDLFLFRSGVFSEFEYLKTVHQRLQKHFDNHGRFNLSVSQSSFDTWLDGYVTGIPNRKTSIYDEGSILAFMMDILIRKNSENQYSLDDVMRYLYIEFGKHEKGYSEADYKSLAEKFAGIPLDGFYNEYVWSANTFEDELKECLNYIGCSLNKAPSKRYHERTYGFKIAEQYPTTKITSVYPNSPADKAGVSINDEIISINGIQIRNDLEQWSRYFAKNPVELNVSSNGTFRNIKITPSKEEYFPIYYIEKIASASEQQKKNFQLWSKRRF
jgi:predicted metalloprotease with PDZ domain